MTLARTLSQLDIETLRERTERLLEEVGFKVMHEGILDLARRAGAGVDESSGIVRFPRPLLRELLSHVPERYAMRGLDGSSTEIGGESRHCLAIVTDPWIVDYATGRPRRPNLEDMRRHTIIGQSLSDVVAMARMDYPVTDDPGPCSSLRGLETHLTHHAKHNFVLPTSLESMEEWLQIGAILARGRELAGSGLFSVGVGIISPLSISRMNCELLLSACRHGFAVVPTICPMAGSTSPYSLASTLLQGNAENVAFAALTQLVSQGNPVQYAFGPSVTDVRTGHDLYYTLDKVAWKLAGIALGRSYGMPTGIECGGSLTYRYDQQNGAEGVLFMLSAYASGANILNGIGSTYNAVGMSAEMMMVHTAWLEAARYLARGIEVDEAHLAYEAIRRVGPGGQFLADDSTIELLRGSDFFASDLFDFSGGSHPAPSLLERAHAKVESIVRAHLPCVPGDVREGLSRWFHDAYRRRS